MDTKILAQESDLYDGAFPGAGDERGSSKLDDLPFYCIGFKSARPRIHPAHRIVVTFATLFILARDRIAAWKTPRTRWSNEPGKRKVGTDGERVEVKKMEGKTKMGEREGI